MSAVIEADADSLRVDFRLRLYTLHCRADSKTGAGADVSVVLGNVVCFTNALSTYLALIHASRTDLTCQRQSAKLLIIPSVF